MSDDQIAQALGQIMGQQQALMDEFRRYTASHDERHTKIDQKIEQHAADINQAKGAKRAVLVIAGLVSATVAYLVKKVF